MPLIITVAVWSFVMAFCVFWFCAATFAAFTNCGSVIIGPSAAEEDVWELESVAAGCGEDTDGLSAAGAVAGDTAGGEADKDGRLIEGRHIPDRLSHFFSSLSTPFRLIRTSEFTLASKREEQTF